MRVQVHTDGVIIALSRRNLLTLLAKLDGYPPHSAKTIMAPAVYGNYGVVAEEDGEHYFSDHRREIVGDTRPGIMHITTEAALSASLRSDDDALN